MGELRTDDIGFGGLKLMQDPDAFCYGTDAVILAGKAAEKAKDTSKIMDMCTGNGIIPLILSHKTDCQDIVGVELQESAYELACKNARLNSLTDRISFMNCDVLDLPDELNDSFTVVTINPPYTEKGRGLTGEESPKSIARHETTAGLEDFIRKASEVLKERGELFMIHRPQRLADLITSSRKYGLEPKTMQLICPHRGEKPNMVILHCVKGAGKQLDIESELFVRDDEENYSEKILKLYL